LTKRQEEILQAVHQLRYVTAWDISRLFYTPTSINHVREILSLLSGKKDYADRHYLFRFPLPHTKVGGTDKIYTLGSRGRAHLQAQGMEVDWYFRPYKVASMTYFNCQHVLTLTRFLVAAHVFCKKHPEWELAELRTEYELKKEISQEKAKQEAARVVIPASSMDGKSDEFVVVIPDAWLDFQYCGKNKKYRVPVFLEIDRASEQQKSFKRQVRARLLFFTSGGYTKLFGTKKGVIAYATTGNQTRLATMMRWTKEVIDDLYKEDKAQKKRFLALFRFCSLTPSWEQDETNLFLAPLWVKAMDKHPVPLLG